MSERRRRPPEETADISVDRRNIRKMPPARTEEEEEKRAYGLAMDRAIELLQSGKASSQIIVHFLKLGSQKEQAELEKTQREIEVLKSKKEVLDAQKESDQKYQELMRAFASYSGKDDGWEVVDDDYEV